MSQTIKASSSAMKICGLGIDSASEDGVSPSSITFNRSPTRQGIRHSYSISRAEAGQLEVNRRKQRKQSFSGPLIRKRGSALCSFLCFLCYLLFNTPRTRLSTKKTSLRPDSSHDGGSHFS